MMSIIIGLSLIITSIIIGLSLIITCSDVDCR